MIKLSASIPGEVPDGSDPKAIADFLTQLKLAVEEIADKAKSVQSPVKSSVPSVADFGSEGEDVRYESGVTRRTYTLLNGSVRYHVET